MTLILTKKLTKCSLASFKDVEYKCANMGKRKNYNLHGMDFINSQVTKTNKRIKT
jgi:hypothetical protein